MVFALLLAAIAWNLGTWYLGLPVSSSHALIGSIMGVGLVNQLMHAQDSYSGIDWSQVQRVGWSLLIATCRFLLRSHARDDRQTPDSKSRALQGAGRQAASMVDQDGAHFHMYGRVLRPWLE